MKGFHGVVRTAVLSIVAGGWLAANAWADNDTFLVAPHDAPSYRLSNLRVEDDEFGRPNLVFNYERTREGKGRVQLAGRTPSGPLTFTFSPDVNRQSDEVRLTKMFGAGGRKYDYEFYFVIPAQWAGDFYGNCLVSNTVRMGSPGTTPRARPWNDAERAAYEKQQRADTPPSQLPHGYESIGSKTELAPGMPVKAGLYGEWVDAEVLTLAPPDGVTIRYAGEDTADTVDRVGWLAAEPEVLRRAKSDPKAYKPSMRVLPGGRFPLPRDAVAIDADLELLPGTPLLMRWGGKWERVPVREDSGVTVSVQYPWHPAPVAWDHKRSELAIRRETIQELGRPGAAERFAKEVDSEADFNERKITVGSDDDTPWGGGGDSYHIADRSYPIEARIPRGAVPVPEDVELPEGTPVAYCWAWEWQPATLVADRGRKLIIKEERDVSGFVYRVPRKQILVQKKTLRKLSRESGATAADLKQTLRTWTDASGQHKVEARFVRVADRKVTLRTDAGREIVLPLDRLCEEDQQLLAGVAPEVDNPFE